MQEVPADRSRVENYHACCNTNQCPHQTNEMTMAHIERKEMTMDGPRAVRAFGANAKAPQNRGLGIGDLRDNRAGFLES